MAKSSSDASDEFERSQRLENERALKERLKTATKALMDAKSDVVKANTKLERYEKEYDNKEREGAKGESLLQIDKFVTALRGVWVKATELETLRAEEVKAIEAVLNIFALDCHGCRLSSAFLEENGLQSYVDGAIACQDKDDVNEVLALLDFDAPNSHISPFVCIVASSGTGKTQLAATAAQSGQHVCYFYTGLLPETLQNFYEPHRRVSEELETHLDTFYAAIRSSVERSGKGSKPKPHAGEIHKFFVSTEEAKRTTAIPLLSLLSKCLLGGDGSFVSFEELRGRIASEKVMVFLDEVPPAGTEDFDRAMLLRNVLRALGLCPILMSTHSGAMNCIPQGSDSRERGEWCRLIVKLPKFHAAQGVFNENRWLHSSERPLVAALMVKHEEKKNITNIVEHVKESLEKRKAQAWDCSILQLCQLMRTKCETNESGVCLEEYNHKVVGVHFGRVTLKGGNIFHTDLGRTDSDYIKRARVAFVDPEIEPVLFLAIMAWKREHLLDLTSGRFPLIAERKPISIRQVFKNNEEFFDQQIRVQNWKAKKLCGDRLEVLALTSVTLASLQYKMDVFDTTCLSDFLAFTFHFMWCQEGLSAEETGTLATAIGTMLQGTSFSSISVPTCCCAESGLAKVWHDVVCGKLERPPDSHNRDGELSLGMESNGNHLLHIECKNHKGGLKTGKFRDIIERIRLNEAHVMLVFTTTLTGMFQGPTWKQVYGDQAGDYCVMVLEEDEARWLEVGVEGKGHTTLSPCPNCKALIVVIAAGAV